MWERRRLRRARMAMLVAVSLLLATAPSAGVHGRRATGPAVGSPSAVVDLAPASTAAPLARGAGVAGPSLQASDAATVEGESAILPPPASFDAPPPRPAPPPAVLHSAAPRRGGGGVWAVVIGIDNYPGSRSDLRASVKDADTVDWALARYGVPVERRLVLRDTQATATVIADAMRWLVDRADPTATAVVFYAGHVRRLRSGAEAIVAADGRLVTDSELERLLRPLAARQTWIALAACYAGGFTELLAPNRILTGAAPAGSLAYENDTYGNSYLVEYMVERAMVRGAAPGSVEQAFAWAHRSLSADHPNRLPVQYDRLDGELSLGTPNPDPVPDEPSSPPPGSGGGAPPPESTPPEEEPDDGGSCLLTLGSLAGCDDRD